MTSTFATRVLATLFALQPTTVTWRRPPSGSLRRGWIWLRSGVVARLVVAAVVIVVVLTIVGFIRQKMRRRKP